MNFGRAKWNSLPLVLSSFSLAVGLFVSACAPPGEPKVASAPTDKTASPAAKNAKQLEDNENESMLLADQAEDLLAPATLDKAKEKLQQALELDPENFRAQFWMAWMAPMDDLRGILGRLRPLYASIPNGAERYSAFVTNFTRQMSPGYRRFFIEGPPNIKTGEELQEWIDRMILRFGELRVFLKANRHQEIRIRGNAELFGKMIDRIDSKSIDKPCGTQKYGPVRFDLGGCGSHYEFMLNRADFEALQQQIAYIESYFTLLNAYKFDPQLLLEMQNVVPAKKEAIGLLAQRERVAKYYSENGNGGLRTQNRIANFKDSLKDLSLSIQYMLDNQAEVCKYGYTTKKNRKGFLISSGLCVGTNTADRSSKDSDNALQMIEWIEGILVGQPLTTEMLRASKPASWGFLALKFIEHPPATVATLAPVEFDRCGSLASINEEPMKPYFASGNIMDIVKSSASYRPCMTPVEQGEGK